MSDPQAPHISVALGVTVGLLASFVQSLGLTVQRKSHLQNEALPRDQRKSDWKRPLWIMGFSVFICSNLLGTIFQIGALPIVVLGPLGAVSLLYNAFFARVILGDQFSHFLIVGTTLVAGGATLIGIFGVLPEETHSLDELIALYCRPSFIIWITLLNLSLVLLLAISHITEWSLERSLQKEHLSLQFNSSTPSAATRTTSNLLWRRGNSLASKVPGVRFTATAPTSRRSSLVPSESGSATHYGTFSPPRSRGGAIGGLEGTVEEPEDGSAIKLWSAAGTSKQSRESREEAKRKRECAVASTRLLLGVAYGIASGNLSGLCLLFAKTGIELLILTVVGQNQFGRFEAWLIVLVLVVAAVLQLFYLNRALRLAGPTLICPLAFCFYNLSSIVSGLIYYNQWSLLSNLQFGLVTLGTAILLTGVWLVSIKVDDVDKFAKEGDLEEEVGLLSGEDELVESPSDTDEPIEWLPRGLTIGISAVSPGFEIRSHRKPSYPPLPPTPSGLFELNLPASPAMDRRRLSQSENDVSGRGDLHRSGSGRRSSFWNRQSISGSLVVGRHLISGATESAPSSPSCSQGPELSELGGVEGAPLEGGAMTRRRRDSTGGG